MKNEDIDGAVIRALHILGEHFSDVQILASRMDEGKTHRVCTGVGNWYARQGLAHEFINADVAQEHAMRLAEKLTPPEGGIA